MNVYERRRFLNLTKLAEPIIDILSLFLISFFFIQFVPISALSSDPATGGDTGSHYWPLYTLVNYSIPNFSLRVWNPGNLGGEPHLVHYFPLPYFIMAALSIFMPLGMAFNIGTLLPLLTLPLSVYFGIRLLGMKFPIPILATCASLCFLYNESFSMWGGNTLSTMAGQFAHVYALNFILLGVGFLAFEIQNSRKPLLSSLCFCAVILSHAYVMLGIPLFMVSFLVLLSRREVKSKLFIILGSGTWAILFSAWYLIPMIDNSKWTIPFFLTWKSPTLLNEIAPSIFYPIIIFFVLSLSLQLIFERNTKRRKIFLNNFLFWLIPILGYIVYYFIFPLVGVIDIRALPQCQLFFCIISAVCIGRFILINRIWTLLIVVPVVCFSLYWVNINIKNFPSWIKWNYSGWKSKPAYKELKTMYSRLQGNFSMPRVIYENSVENGKAGTIRVFEMLPYFTNRSTLESVYLQASILAPAAFLLQAEISKTASCPFIQFECVPYNIQKVKDSLRLLGVGELILITPELLAMADKSDYLEKDGQFNIWHLYKVKEQPQMAEVFNQKPILSSDAYWKGRFFKRSNELEQKQGIDRVEVRQDDWKDLFYSWLKNYKSTDPMIVVDQGEESLAIDNLKMNDDADSMIWRGGGDCRPEVEVDFNKIHLKTNCPGKAHFIKYAYHSNWKTSTGDIPFLVSPGFIGLIPSEPEVILIFGESNLWRAAGAISIISIFFVIFCYIWHLRCKYFKINSRSENKN